MKKINDNELELANKISLLQKRGDALIYPEKVFKWHQCVIDRIDEKSNGDELTEVLKIMEVLEQGKTFEEISELTKGFDHSSSSWYEILHIVAYFSKRGTDFFKAFYGQSMNEETVKFLDRIDQKNCEYQKNSKKRDMNLDR